MAGASPRGGLSPRQHDVLALMAQGLTNEAIAARLALALKSIESVVRSIFDRLDLALDPGINRRVVAVRRFLEFEVPRAASVPAPASALVGRSVEIAELERLLGEQRLVTITGVGGIGK